MPENRRLPTIHTLNAARVCMEFLVVHNHIAFTFHDVNHEPLRGGPLEHGVIATNLMSFFFVLSGFTATYSNWDVDWKECGSRLEYIQRRLNKVYPAYIFWYLLDLPGNIIDKGYACKWSWIARISQPFLVNAWLGCMHIASVNNVSWYLCTLFWLWFMFPFLNVRRIFTSHPWLKITTLYVFSVMLWFPLVYYNTIHTRQIPFFRLPEFLMGCGVACTLESKINGWIVLFGFCVFLAYCVADFEMPGVWENDETGAEKCTVWSKNGNTVVKGNAVLSKFAIVWAMLVHWLAASEKNGDANLVIKALSWDGFKSLNGFALHLYLGHVVSFFGIRDISQLLHVWEWWSMDTVIMACYFTTYLVNECEAWIRGWVRAWTDQHVQENGGVELEPLNA